MMTRVCFVLCLVVMLVIELVGISFSENAALRSPMTDEQFQGFLKKAMDGDVKAQALIGSLYIRGEGCDPDDVKGIVWLTKAAQQGHKEAAQVLDVVEKYISPAVAMRLTAIYMNGVGVPQNYELAARWVHRAAELGVADGQVVLGMLYLIGAGVNKDLLKAHMWCNIAASRVAGQEKNQAVQCREDAEKQMTMEQIREAQRLAATWKPKNLDEQKH